MHTAWLESLNAPSACRPRTLLLRAQSHEDRTDWFDELSCAIEELDRTNDAAFYRRMPKTELHVQLLGCVRRSTALELARELRVDTDADAARSCPEGIVPLLNKYVDGSGLIHLPELVTTCPQIPTALDPAPEPEPLFEPEPEPEPEIQLPEPQTHSKTVTHSHAKSRASARRMTNDVFSAHRDVGRLLESGMINMDAMMEADSNACTATASAVTDERHKYCVLLDTIWQVLQTPEIVSRCTQEALEDLHADGVIYAELHITPRNLASMTKADYISAVASAIKANNSSIEVRIVVNIQRCSSFEDAQSTVEAALGCPELCVGVALVGDARFDKFETWDRLKQAFEHARRCGLRVSLSSFMEVMNTSEACEQIDFDPDRLGHASTMLTDKIFIENFAAPLASFPIPIEIHATAEVMTQLNINSIHDHHFVALRSTLRNQSGNAYPLVICSSYPSIFPNSRLSDEITKLASTFGLSRAEMQEIQINQIAHCFCDEETRSKIRAKYFDMVQRSDSSTAASTSDGRTRRASRIRTRAAKSFSSTMKPMRCVL